MDAIAGALLAVVIVWIGLLVIAGLDPLGVMRPFTRGFGRIVGRTMSSATDACRHGTHAAFRRLSHPATPWYGRIVFLVGGLVAGMLWMILALVGAFLPQRGR